MSDTPRTDAALDGPGNPTAFIAFARELERQLDQRTPCCEGLREALKLNMDWIGPPPTGKYEYDSLREDAWAKGKEALAQSCSCQQTEASFLCESHRAAYKLAPPPGCIACELVHQQTERKEGDASCLHKQRSQQGSGEPESSSPPVAQEPPNQIIEVDEEGKVHYKGIEPPLQQTPAIGGGEEWTTEKADFCCSLIPQLDIVIGRATAEKIVAAHNAALGRESEWTNEKVKELRKADSLVISELTEMLRQQRSQSAPVDQVFEVDEHGKVHPYDPFNPPAPVEAK